MRLPLSLLLACYALTAAAEPQKISFTRVFPNAGQLSLSIAAADGSDEHPLFDKPGLDYDAVWSPDGATIVFTSEREGSADIYRVKPDGTGLERLTDDPAYDDQAAFSPDSQKVVFVSSRNGGMAHLWILDLTARRTRALTTGDGGDFRRPGRPTDNGLSFRPTGKARCRSRMVAGNDWRSATFL